MSYEWLRKYMDEKTYLLVFFYCVTSEDITSIPAIDPTGSTPMPEWIYFTHKIMKMHNSKSPGPDGF